jgi:hypothetical protein
MIGFIQDIQAMNGHNTAADQLRQKSNREKGKDELNIRIKPRN